MTYPRFIVAIVFCGAALRLIDIDGVNFAPIGAIAVFSGLTFRNKWLAFGLPLVTTLIADVGLALQNSNDIGTYLFNSTMLFVYLGWLMYAFCGLGVRRVWSGTTNDSRRGWLLCGGSLLGSVLFFLISNFGWWVAGANHSLASLVTCFVKAIPFYRGTMFSDLIYLAVLVAAYAGVAVLVRSKNRESELTFVYAD